MNSYWNKQEETKLKLIVETVKIFRWDDGMESVFQVRQQVFDS